MLVGFRRGIESQCATRREARGTRNSREQVLLHVGRRDRSHRDMGCLAPAHVHWEVEVATAARVAHDVVARQAWSLRTPIALARDVTDRRQQEVLIWHKGLPPEGHVGRRLAQRERRHAPVEDAPLAVLGEATWWHLPFERAATSRASSPNHKRASEGGLQGRAAWEGLRGCGFCGGIRESAHVRRHTAA